VVVDRVRTLFCSYEPVRARSVMNLKLWLDTVTTAFIVVGGVLALLQLRQTHKQRSRESALQMLHSFQTPEFLTAVNIVFDLPEGLSKHEVEQRVGDQMTCLLVMMGTFESLGILVYRRDIDIALVEDFFSGVAVLSRRKLQSYLDEVRRCSGRETYYEWYQWLSELVERRENLAPVEPSFKQFRDWNP
jgi:hypothetical protein